MGKEGKRKKGTTEKREKKKTGLRVLKGENYPKFVFLFMNIYHGMKRKQSKYILLLKQGKLLSVSY